MAKSFYFWQTVSKRPNLDDVAFKKAKWQPCLSLYSLKNNFLKDCISILNVIYFLFEQLTRNRMKFVRNIDLLSIVLITVKPELTTTCH